MKFREYLHEQKIRYRTAAESLGISEQSVKNIAAGTKRPGLLLALRIEKFTEGAVTPQQLAADFDSQVKAKDSR